MIPALETLLNHAEYKHEYGLSELLNEINLYTCAVNSADILPLSTQPILALKIKFDVTGIRYILEFLYGSNKKKT